MESVLKLRAKVAALAVVRRKDGSLVGVMPTAKDVPEPEKKDPADDKQKEDGDGSGEDPF